LSSLPQPSQPETGFTAARAVAACLHETPPLPCRLSEETHDLPLHEKNAPPPDLAAPLTPEHLLAYLRLYFFRGPTAERASVRTSFEVSQAFHYVVCWAFSGGEHPIVERSVHHSSRSNCAYPMPDHLGGCPFSGGEISYGSSRFAAVWVLPGLAVSRQGSLRGHKAWEFS
jgi:hypothetical protein